MDPIFTNEIKQQYARKQTLKKSNEYVSMKTFPGHYFWRRPEE